MAPESTAGHWGQVSVERSARDLNDRGFALGRNVVGEDSLAVLRALLTEHLSTLEEPHGPSYAIRHVLTRVPLARDVLAKTSLAQLASAAMGATAEAVDATFFDKTPAANWTVPAHQDVVMPAVAVPEVLDVFERHGGTYADAPDEVLHQILALRLHLDDCPQENGALWVVPGSHRHRLGSGELDCLPRESFVPCPAAAGDVLLMRPLLVHRSSPAVAPTHRRVLHLLYRIRSGLTSTRS